MRFLYVFSMMFLSIFGLVVLLKVLFSALLDGSRKRFKVYIRDCEDIEEFLESAKKSAFIERVIVITDKAEKSEERQKIRKITEKYAGFVAKYEKM